MNLNHDMDTQDGTSNFNAHLILKRFINIFQMPYNQAAHILKIIGNGEKGREGRAYTQV